MSNSSHPHNHTHLRDSEYPSVPDSSMRSSTSGYPYSTSSPQHALPPPPMQQAPPQQQQHPSAYSSPPQASAYVTTEGDATYYRTMLRELGFGEGTDSGAYPAVTGFALTMPEAGAAFGAPQPGAVASGIGYHDTSHGGYGHTNPGRHHYHPYPPPPYTNSHNGYSGMVSR